jgi:hypothetical protein
VNEGDLQRVWAKLDDDEGPIYLSTADLVRIMQPNMTKTTEAAFSLLRQEIPLIVRATVKEYIAEQEAEKQRIAAQFGLVIDPDGTVHSRVNPVRQFLQKNAVSITLFLIILIILAPRGFEWLLRSAGFLRWATNT